jgi:hypothetical protein
MVLAFKLYGDFHWPPTPTPAADPKTKFGTIEIYYAPKDGSDELHAFLRWVPQGLKPPPAEPPEKNIYRIPNAVQWFVDNKDKIASIWIDEEVATPDGIKVAFRGAFLIDQYQTEATAKPPLDLRWPLVRACSYRKNQLVHSELVVYRNSGSSIFRFNLHLPLPVRRTTLRTANYNDPAAFPFCAVYETNRPPDKILDFTALVGGWINNDDEVHTSFVFDRDTSPETRRLGRFGFAALAAGAAKRFAVYKGNAYPGPIAPFVDPFDFWPRHSEAFVHDVLSRSGFNVPPSKDWLEVDPDRATDLSLRFRPKGGRNGALIYRMRIVVAPNPDKPGEEDIRSFGGLALRLKPETGGWLRTAATVYVECELSWEIPDDNIFHDRATHWTVRSTVKLLWDETIAPGFAAPPHADGILFAGTLAQAAHSFTAARKGLEAVESGQPQSFLPDLEVEKNQTVRFALYAPSLPAHFVSNSNLVAWGRPEKIGKSQPMFIRPRMRLSLAGVADLVDGSEKPESVGLLLALHAEHQTFFTGDGIRCDLVLSNDKNWVPRNEEDIADGEPFFASFTIAVSGPKDWQGRLSSLQFERAQEDKKDEAKKKTLEPWAPEGTHYLRAGGPGVRYGMGHGAAPIDLAAGHVAASISIMAPVSRVEPIAVDVARTDRTGRPAPLVIPQNQSQPGAGRFYLQATETISPTQDRLLEVDVREDTLEHGDRSYVVLSQEPFSVLRFTHRPLGDRGDLSSASVAFYSSDDRIWQFRQVADHYHYVLPPQVIGESADKPRRLEIHDLPDGATEMPPRPFVGTNATEGDLQRRAVEYRLTPSAELWIRPSDVARGYFMPESASYEIFRQRGEYGLGAPLAFVRAEFLYGLPVGIDVAKERSVARLARVAEIEALTGRIVGEAREKGADRTLSDRWNDLSRALARRPERLEVWARDPDSTVDFTPARFSDGVSFALRSTALHRAPLKPLEETDDYGKAPKVGRKKPNEDELTLADSGKPRHHPQGLSGGALWPVESVNLFNVLLDRPDSRGGAIESIAFSPIGGDATQKAEFLNGIVTILSETRNGFIERQKVEVLGRICALWHRAKHVVVYERTVNPSAQFAPKHEDDPDRTRSRRPILRKVREYIELREPERAYPDFDNAVPRSAGFLDRVRFNSKIINVDSAWSSEVGNDAWQIPLWNRLSARERPQVYPMPDVAFVTAAEGEGEKPVVAQECRDPDFLFFFADFNAGTSDTNQWAARLDLDYANMPTAQAIAQTQDKQPDSVADTSHGADPRQRSVSRFLPGLRRFTWRLAPAAQKTAINAGRAGKPVYVGIDSLTFMRASHVADAQKILGSGLGTLLDTVAALPKPDKEPPKIKELNYWDGSGNGSQVPDGDQFSKLVGKLRDALGKDKPVEAEVKQALQDLRTKWNASGGTYAQVVVDDVKQRAADAKDFFKGLDQSLGGFIKGENPCDKLKSDAVGAIKRKEMLIRTALSDWTADAERVLPTLEFPSGTPIETKDALINALLDLSVTHIRPLFAEASQDVGKAGEGVEKARAVVLDLEAEFEAVVERARQRIEQFAAGYDRDKPWSAERLKAFRAGLRACTGNLAADIAALIDEARQRFAAELDDASQAIGGYLARALSAILEQQGALLSGVGALGDVLKRHLNDARAMLDKLAPVSGTGILDEAIGKIDNAIAGIDGNGAIDPTLKAKAKAVLTAVRKVANDAKTTVAGARQRIDDAATIGDDALDQVATEILAVSGALASVAAAIAGKATELLAVAKELSDAGFDAISDELKAVWPDVEDAADKLADWIDKKLAPLRDIGRQLDLLVAGTIEDLQKALKQLRQDVRAVEGKVTELIGDMGRALQATQLALAPESLLETAVRRQVLRPAFEEVLKPLTDAHLKDAGEALKLIRVLLRGLSEALQEPIRKLSVAMLGTLDEISLACSAAFESVDKVRSYVEALATDAMNYLGPKADELRDAFKTVTGRIDDALKDFDKFADKAKNLLATVNALDHSVRGLQNDLARSTETARMYADRVFGAAGRLGEGGLMAAPSNVLKLYSAVTSAPELAALKANIDRIRAGFDELSDVIDTTEAKALFNRLGDELKALGLSLPFDKIGDRLLPVDLSKFDINAVFRNFGGAKLDSLFKGFKLPAGVRDAIKVTHDFDKAQARAWVQVDINAPMPGRRSLFAVGPFKADFVDMMLTGQVRLEVSKDQDRVMESGFGRIDTSIDVVVGGQSMVRFDKFALAFTREKGLDIEFDPKNIRLNPSFKFIQDFLATLFPDEIGGLKVIKLDGMPIGIEHEFSIPPLALNFGTSGVSNISIENRFKLLAYPDFMLANRFNLSTVERPFIFSIFIIGGTGYIQVDAEYRPFDSELMVAVEAGAGGSASLAFAFGPFSGQVFITLSGVLSYRKVIGRPGGGLSIASVLVIAGHVNVAGIVTVGIVLMLRMTYRDNGQIDADGTLTVTIRISRFFKITARASAKYKLRGGKSETTTSTSVSAEAPELQKAAKKLQGARS